MSDYQEARKMLTDLAREHGCTFQDKVMQLKDIADTIEGLYKDQSELDPSTSFEVVIARCQNLAISLQTLVTDLKTCPD